MSRKQLPAQPAALSVPIALPQVVMGEPPAYTIDEFCESHRISKPALYEMVANGRAPKIIRKGENGVIIPREAAEEWRRAQAQEWTVAEARSALSRKRRAASEEA